MALVPYVPPPDVVHDNAPVGDQADGVRVLDLVRDNAPDVAPVLDGVRDDADDVEAAVRDALDALDSDSYSEVDEPFSEYAHII